MSLALVSDVFEKISQCGDWSLYLVRINENLVEQTVAYVARALSLRPQGSLNDIIRDISKEYSPTKLSKKYINVNDYDGTTNARLIYKLVGANELIAANYEALSTVLATPDVEVDPFEFKPQLYVLKGNIQLNEEDIMVKIVSMKKPITLLKHKFWKDDGVFTKISDKVLSLNKHVDVLIVGDTVYFMSLDGEKLFCMERAYKKQAKETVQMICNVGVLSDVEKFKEIAQGKHYPRTLIAFNKDRLALLSDERARRTLAEQFNITLLDDMLFDTDDEENVDRIIKFLCNRAMLDIDNVPVEVDGARIWH